jgi:hypothetical protein
LGTSGATLGISGGVHLYAQSQLRFADADSSNWVGFKSPATVANNVVWTLPGTTGSVNQVLQLYDGSGGLTWASLQAGVVGSDKQIQYNASGGLSASSAFVISNSLYGGGSIVSRGGGVNSFSTAFGCNALYGNSAGNYNTAIGYSAASNITFGDCNTAIGFMAGANESSDNAPNCNATRSIYIGACSKALDNGLCDEIVIGANAMGCGTFTTVIGSTAQTAATIYGVLNLPSGLSASALYASAGSTFASTVTVSGGATFASTTDHVGIARFGAGITTSALNVTGAARFDGGVASGVTFASTTDHVGIARFGAGITTSALNVTGVSKFAGGVTFASTTDHVGIARFASTICINSTTAADIGGNGSLILQGGIYAPKYSIVGGIPMGATGGSIAIGTCAMCNLSCNISNIAIGNESMSLGVCARENIAIGYKTLNGPMIGTAIQNFQNIAIGNCAMQYNCTGFNNVAIGVNAMSTACSSACNVAIGNLAGNYGVSASDNVFIGELSGYHNNGCCNVAIGSNAGYCISGLSCQNTIVGAFAAASAATTSPICSATSIGFRVPALANTVRIGISNTDFVSRASNVATWTNSSDCRLKKCIAPGNIGLSFINRLCPVTFQLRSGCELPQDMTRYDEADSAPQTKTHYGFIAQDIKAVIDEEQDAVLLKDWLWSEMEDGVQQLGQTDLIPPLVNAIKELSARVKLLETRINMM